MSKSFDLAASVLSANWSQLAETAQELQNSGVDRLHIDVMDGQYVPNLTFGPAICQHLHDAGITLPMDVHLMVTPVDPVLDMIASNSTDIVYIHPETTHHLQRQLARIREMGCRAGLALNPTTPLDILDSCHRWLDEVLLMTVNPGFGGQKLIDGMAARTQACHQRLQALGWDGRIAIDGAMTDEVIGEFITAGAQHIVVGSYLFRQDSIASAVQKLHSVTHTK